MSEPLGFPGWLSLEVILMVASGLFLLGLVLRFRPQRTRAPKRWKGSDLQQYRLKSDVFSSSEKRLLRALEARFGRDYVVAPLVRMEDVVEVGAGLMSRERRQALRGRVKSRHFDFVILTRQGRPVLAVEYDGKYHAVRAQSKVDAFKNELCEAVGLPLLRVSGHERDWKLDHIRLPS